MGKNNGTPLAEMIDYPTNPCLLCGKSSIVPLEPTKFFAWRKGELIQEVWPEKNDSERELLITGTHPECWTKIMGEEVE